jgi:hypothetical protein
LFLLGDLGCADANDYVDDVDYFRDDQVTWQIGQAKKEGDLIGLGIL